MRTETDRERVESLVRNTSGVVAVKDKLRVLSPEPGVHGAFPSALPPTAIPVIPPSAIPVYAAPPPEVTPPPTVLTMPAPVIIPDFPKLKLQAATGEDVPAANRIAQELRAEAVPMTEIDEVTILVRNGIVSLRGMAARETRAAIVKAVQRAGGVSAIYDQLLLR